MLVSECDFPNKPVPCPFLIDVTQGSNSFRPGITIPHLNCPGISFTLYILLHDIVDFMNPMILSSLKNKVGLPNVVIKALTILSSRINIIAQS